MPSIGIGVAVAVGRSSGAPSGSAGDGLAAALRDQFTTTINPVVDAATEPGTGSTAGLRDVTSAAFQILNGKLRVSGSAGAWGDRKMVFKTAGSAGYARADGLAMWTVYVPMNREADAGIGWAIADTVTTPLTTGHHWLMNDGYPRVSIPGKNVALSSVGDLAKIGAFRAVEYLIVVVLRATGAYYLVSSFAAHTRTGVANSNDYIGIPAFPDARVLWVDDATTTTPMFPHFGVLDNIGPPNGHAWDDVRVKSITSWATDAGLATFLDRITRADSTTSIGASWTNDVGVFGVTTNKVHCQTTVGHNIAWADSGLVGDGIWRCRITAPTSITNQFGFMFRRASLNNYCFIHNSGGDFLTVHKNVAGAFTQLQNTAFDWTGGQVYDICVITKGNQIQVYVDGTLIYDWFADGAGSTFTTATGFGPYCFNTTAAGGRWDDFMAVPSTVTLPADIQIGQDPHIFTAGSTLLSDAFTAANGTAISGRTPDTGAAWSVSGAGWEINTNRARNTNTNGADAGFFAYSNCGTADVEWESPILSAAAGDWIYCGALLRYTDANNWIVARLRMGADQPGNDEIEVVEMVAGVETVVLHQQFGDFYALNTTYTVKVQVVSDMLHMLVNGEPFGSLVTRVTSGNNHGLYHNGQDDGSSFASITVKALT
jgi:hypothetical protein